MGRSEFAKLANVMKFAFGVEYNELELNSPHFIATDPQFTLVAATVKTDADVDLARPFERVAKA
eukprot:5994496-Alexandrium_andersonii.AAC.1